MASLRNKSFWANKARVEVRTHSEFRKVLLAVHEHLDSHPEDGDLFLMSPAKAVAGLGFELTDELNAHLTSQFLQMRLIVEETAPLYERALSGDLSPFDIQVRLRPPGGAVSFRPSDHQDGDIETHPLSVLAKDQAREAFAESIRRAGKSTATTAPIPVSMAKGFDVAFQLSETAVNQVIEEAFLHGGVHRRWAGRQTGRWDEFGLAISVSYEAELDTPTVRLGDPDRDSVTLELGATAVLKLDLFLDDLPVPGDQSFDFGDDLTIAFSVTVAAAVKVDEGSMPNLVAAFIDLKSIRDLKLEIQDGPQLPEPVANLIAAGLELIARNHLVQQSGIPLSMDLEEVARAGVPISAPRSLILQATETHEAALTLLIDVRNSTPGDFSAIEHFIPSGEDFAFIISSTLIYLGWEHGKRTQFPIDDGKLIVDSPDFRLLDNRFYTKADAHYEVINVGGCDIITWTIDARVRVWAGLQSFQHDGIWFVRPATVATDIDMDDWDQFVAETILGFILMLLGVGGPVARSIISKIIFQIIIGLAEKYASEEIGGYSVGIYGRIPGTNRIIYSSTPVLPVIKPDGISSFGNLEFRTTV